MSLFDIGRWYLFIKYMPIFTVKSFSHKSALSFMNYIPRISLTLKGPMKFDLTRFDWIYMFGYFNVHLYGQTMKWIQLDDQHFIFQRYRSSGPPWDPIGYVGQINDHQNIAIFTRGNCTGRAILTNLGFNWRWGVGGGLIELLGFEWIARKQLMNVVLNLVLF